MLVEDVRQLSRNLLPMVTRQSLFPILCRSLCRIISFLPCLALVMDATKVLSQTSVLTVRFLANVGSDVTSISHYRLYVNKGECYRTVSDA